jgi:hypothetical protein
MTCNPILLLGGAHMAMLRCVRCDLQTSQQGAMPPPGLSTLEGPV